MKIAPADLERFLKKFGPAVENAEGLAAFSAGFAAPTTKNLASGG